MPQTWVVRAGNGNELIDPFRQQSVVAIGWNDLGNLSHTESREDIKRLYRDSHPEYSENRMNNHVGQVFRFAHKMADGDIVLTYDNSVREYHIGYLTGSYEWRPGDGVRGYSHVRPVDWLDEPIGRDTFSTSLKNALGSPLTVFSVDDYRDEIDTVLSDEEPISADPEDNEEDEESDPLSGVESRADERISDILANMDPFDFEELVAAVLRSMGYTANRTGEGADHGVDITAHPDALGFETPVIKVQVKRRQDAMGSSEIRDFIGTLTQDETGLYVSTGGYTRHACSERERTNKRLTLLDREEFVDLLKQHYQNIDPEHQAYVPLKRIYIPAE
ncbi:restriction endonuclease [Halobacteriales archaeon QS_3_64_16]|nr:MAG: restriction endonuclease [Halobacteriales archaeon QS_3_64_16]